MMGNWMYDGRGYKNTFMVKKNITVASDRDVVNTFMKIAKENPTQVAKDMASAYNDIYIFQHKTVRSYQKKISKLNDADSRRARELPEDFVSNAVLSDKAETSTNWIATQRIICQEKCEKKENGFIINSALGVKNEKKKT